MVKAAVAGTVGPADATSEFCSDVELVVAGTDPAVAPSDSVDEEPLTDAAKKKKEMTS